MLRAGRLLKLSSSLNGWGCLAEARTAWNDETATVGCCTRLWVERVFGCREKGAEGVGEDTRVPVRIVCAHPALPTLQEGDVLLGAFFRESLELLSSDAEIVEYSKMAHLPSRCTAMARVGPCLLAQC